jgi:hypothetical protein
MGAKKEGCRIPDRVPIRESGAGSYRRKFESSTDRGFLLNSFSNEVARSVSFGDRFNQVGTPLDERIRKLFDGFQHQLQLVFAVVARFVFAASMTGDRIVSLFLDLGITPLRLDIIAE